MLDDATIVQLEYFRTVVRLGSLTRAAESLSVTQPTLSTAIARLERQYRIQLLARIPRKGVEPTLAGYRLLAALEPLLDSVGRLGSIARGTDDLLQGELSVGVHTPLAPIYSSAILLEAARLMPGVTLTLTEGLEELPAALLRRQLDVALLYAEELTPEFGITPLRDIAPHVVVAEDHRLIRAGRTSVSLHELADEPAVFLTLADAFKRYMSYFRALNITPNVKYTSTSYEVIRSYVASGLGYALLHHEHRTRQTHCGRSLVPLRIEDDVTPAQLCVVSPSWDQPPAHTARLIEVIGKVVEQVAASTPL